MLHADSGVEREEIRDNPVFPLLTFWVRQTVRMLSFVRLKLKQQRTCLKMIPVFRRFVQVTSAMLGIKGL